MTSKTGAKAWNGNSVTPPGLPVVLELVEELEVVTVLELELLDEVLIEGAEEVEVLIVVLEVVTEEVADEVE